LEVSRANAQRDIATAKLGGQLGDELCLLGGAIEVVGRKVEELLADVELGGGGADFDNLGE